MHHRALNFLLLPALLLALAACADREKPATAVAECRIFVAPTRPVQGKTPADQFWIDVNIERGIGGCGWPRPSSKDLPGVPAR